MAAVSATVVSATLGSVVARQAAATQVLISIGGHSERSLRNSRTFRGQGLSSTVFALKGCSMVTGDGRQGADESSRKNLAQQITKLSSVMTALAATILFAASVNVAEASSLEIEAGAVFERSCAGCHAGGGNILQPAATLRKGDLDKNGLAAVDDIYNITYFGKNRMPGYGEKCTPVGQCTFGPRLSEENIRALAEFVKLQADRDWSK